MEKISSILPSNGRIKSVDLSDAQPVRPGAPNYGSPAGAVTVKDRVSLTSSPREAAKETMTYKNPRESAKAKIVADITSNFFNKRLEKPVIEKATQGQEALEVLDEAPTQISHRERAELSPKSLESAAPEAAPAESQAVAAEI